MIHQLIHIVANPSALLVREIVVSMKYCIFIIVVSVTVTVTVIVWLVGMPYAVVAYSVQSMVILTTVAASTGSFT